MFVVLITVVRVWNVSKLFWYAVEAFTEEVIQHPEQVVLCVASKQPMMFVWVHLQQQTFFFWNTSRLIFTKFHFHHFSLGKLGSFHKGKWSNQVCGIDKLDSKWRADYCIHLKKQGTSRSWKPTCFPKPSNRTQFLMLFVFDFQSWDVSMVYV